MQEALVQSLAREQRSCMLHSMTPPPKKKKITFGKNAEKKEIMERIMKI